MKKIIYNIIKYPLILIFLKTPLINLLKKRYKFHRSFALLFTKKKRNISASWTSDKRFGPNLNPSEIFNEKFCWNHYTNIFNSLTEEKGTEFSEAALQSIKLFYIEGWKNFS